MILFRFLILSFFLCYSVSVLSQTNYNKDSLSGYIKYHSIAQQSPFSEKLININSFLDFNYKESFFIKNKLGMDSIADLGGTKYDDKSVLMTSPTHDETGYITYRNFETKEVSFNYQKVGPLPAYKVIDDWIEMEWNILEDTKIIAGKLAKKATTTFRGTDFIVWFTNDIPLPYGPLKLFGLPGVILEVWFDNKQQIIAYEVCYPCENINKIVPPPETLTKTIQEHVHIRDNFEYYLFLEMNKNSKGMIMLKEMPTEKGVLEKRKQNLEKIYEWENKKTKRLVKSSELRKMVSPKRNINESGDVKVNSFPSQITPSNYINQ